jgi:hypothetical protein
MALPLVTILKTIPTILGALQQISSSLSARRAAGVAGRIEDRTTKLEEDLLKASTAVAELARQVEAIGQELRTQAERNVAQTKQLRVVLALAIAAFLGSFGSMIALLTRGP